MLSMDLITPKEAAALAHVSRETIQYWVKTERLAKYPYPLSASSKRSHKRETGTRRFLLSKEEVLRNGPGTDLQKFVSKHQDLNLLTVKQVSLITGQSVDWVRKFVKDNQLEKYKFSRSAGYLVDGEKFADALESSGLGHLIK